ncbi:formyltransferase family protein [Deinococcus aestuarii]|uniref:formyltransferase family protein n=1 Tax=Deinococcus aestuarii TaxID=2774531 RepID=UPI001C0D7A0A|nr:formyltransferase family protein [Deinococcus aestuarii]
MKMLFMGRKPAAARALEWSVANGFEVVGVVTDSHIANSPTAAVAAGLGLPLFSLEEVCRLIGDGLLDLDVAVSFVYWKKIKPPLLGHPRSGIVNFHPAPLPEYKGTAGYNLAILDALDAWSVTAHYIDRGIDTGRIIERFSFSIDSEEETALTLEAKSQAFMLALYKKVMRRVLRFGLLPSESNEGGRYVSRAQMEAMKRVEEGDDVGRKVRAFWFPPYTGAYIEIGGVKYTLVNDAILQSLVEDGQTYQLPAASGRAGAGAGRRPALQPSASKAGTK